MSQHEEHSERPCAHCGTPVLMVDLPEAVPACSVDCAVALMDAWENVRAGRQHLDTIECWCGPAIILIEETAILDHRD